MKNKKNDSEFNLLSGRARFTNEPLWYRIIVIVFMAAFILLLTWILKEWVIPLFAKNWAGTKIGELTKFVKGRAP
jgi:hypothetical protein